MLTVLLLRSLLSFKFKSTHGIVPLPTLHHVTPLPSARTALPWAFLEIFYLSLVIWNWPFVHSLFQSGNSPLLFLGGVLILFLNNTLFSICSVCFPQLMLRTFSLLVFYSLLWNISSSLSSNPSVEVFDYTVFFFFSVSENTFLFSDLLLIVTCSCWIDCVAFLTSLIMFGVVFSAPCIDSFFPPIFLFWFVFG